jgi:hypothetical protein
VNAKELRKNVGAPFRIRPIPWRVDANGRRLKDVDYQWRLDAVDMSPIKVRLINTATGHVVELEPDNVIERRSPDFLMLRCQLILEPTGVGIEPIFRGTPVTPAAHSSHSASPESMSPDELAVLKHVASEGGAVSQHSESHTDAGLSRIRYEEAVHALLSRHLLQRGVNSYHTRLFPRLTLTSAGRRWAIANGLA